MKENQIDIYTYIAEKTGLDRSAVKSTIYVVLYSYSSPMNLYTCKDDSYEEKIKFCDDIIEKVFKK